MSNRKRWNRILGAGLLAVVILGLFFAAGQFQKKQKVSAAENPDSQISEELVYDEQGNAYCYRKNLTNVLFMGVDKNEPVTLENTAGVAGQADCVMIFSFDREKKTVQILQISRDSMTDIDIYDIDGDYYTTVTAQLATQYAYGKGEKSSCWAMKKTVSELLYDLPIDGYISLMVEAVGIASDAVGGVTLTLKELPV